MVTADGATSYVDYTPLLDILDATGMGAKAPPPNTPSQANPHEVPDLTLFACQVAFFAMEPAGWLRITSSADSKTVYIKFKWTTGPFANKYIMAVVQGWQIPYGFAVLYEKYWKAKATGQGLSEDRPYNHQRGNGRS